MSRGSEADAAIRRVLANTGVLLGGRAANAVMGLATVALTARALGLERFGVLVLIHAFAQFLGETAKFKSWQTVLYFGTAPLADGRIADFQRVMRFSIALDLLGSAVGVGVGLAAVFWFGEVLGIGSADRPAAALYVLCVAFMVSATPMGLLRLFDRFDVLAWQTVLIALVRLAGSAAAFAFDAPMPVFLFVWGLSVVAGYGYITARVAAELGRRGLLSGFPWRGRLTAGMPGAWRFAWSTNLSATLDVAFTHVVTLAIGIMVGPAEAALWRVGRQVALAMARPARLLTAALYPELARFNAQDGSRGAALWRLASRIGLLAGGIGALILALSLGAGALLLRLTVGPEFVPAAGLMNWQVGAAVIGLVSLPLEPMLVAFGLAGRALRVRAVVCVVYLAALVPVVKAFGTEGAAIALVCAAAAMAAGMLLAVLRMPPDRAPVARPAPEALARAREVAT